MARIRNIFFIAVLLGSMSSGCDPRKAGLNGIPATFVATLAVEPKDRQTLELYNALMDLAKSHGMVAHGDGAIGGREWQIQIFCRENFVGGATTARKGDFVLVNAAPYAFRKHADYRQFTRDMVARMRPFGVISGQKETAPLSQAQLLERGRYTGLDVTSQCGPGK
jgi:hypothetical protein